MANKTKAVNDGLQNLVSQMGTNRDKAAHTQYFMSLLDDNTLLTAYKSSGLARRVIDLHSEEPFRAWRIWQADKDQISLLEAEEKRLGIPQKVIHAKRLANLFGRAAILIGDGASDVSKPLDPKSIKQGGIKCATVISKNQLTAGQIDWRVNSPYFGQPQDWALNLQGDTGKLIHPSRLVIFYGHEPMGDMDVNISTGTGDSILQGGFEDIKRVDALAANIESLTFEAKVDVISIPDFMQKLASDGQEYESLILSRFSLANRGKGINGALIIDANEKYESKSASFGGLDVIFDRFAQMVCAKYAAPMSLLFGRAAGGLNATGESDIRAWYDKMGAIQKNAGRAMSVLDECLIYSALGQRPESVFYEWKPLWQPTAKEQAETGNIMMDALTKLDNLQGFSAGVIGKAAANALIETGGFSGLEAAIDENDDTLPPDDTDGIDTDL